MVDICQNYFWKDENYSIEAHVFGHERLVVCFDHAGGKIHRPDLYREGWGEAYFRKRKISCVCVKVKKTDWFRSGGVSDGIKAFHEIGFWNKFKSITTYGGSMGGFGALRYADEIGAENVIAFAPQSTLTKWKVPFEKRFRRAQKQENWKGPDADAVGKFTGAKNVYIIADMMLEPDRLHVKRLMSKNVILLNTPFFGHDGIPKRFIEMGILNDFIESAMNGDVDKGSFYKKIRARRNLYTYRENVTAAIRKRRE